MLECFSNKHYDTIFVKIIRIWKNTAKTKGSRFFGIQIYHFCIYSVIIVSKCIICLICCLLQQTECDNFFAVELYYKCDIYFVDIELFGRLAYVMP